MNSKSSENRVGTTNNIDDSDSINIASPPSNFDHHQTSSSTPSEQPPSGLENNSVERSEIEDITISTTQPTTPNDNSHMKDESANPSTLAIKPLNPLIPTLVTSPIAVTPSTSKLIQLSPRAQYLPHNMHLNIDNLLIHHGSERLASPSRALVNNIIHHLSPHHLSPRYQAVVSTEDEDSSNTMNEEDDDDDEELNILIDNSTHQPVLLEPSKSKSPPPTHSFRKTSPSLKKSGYSGSLTDDDEEDDDEEELEENIESSEEDDEVQIDINSPPEEDQVEGFNMSNEDLLDELHRSNARLAYAESKDSEDEDDNQSLMNFGETNRNSRRRGSTSPLTVKSASSSKEKTLQTPTMTRDNNKNQYRLYNSLQSHTKLTFSSIEEEAKYYKLKYLEISRDLQTISENYEKYQKRSEELEQEYDAELERYESLLQKSDLKINVLLEQIKQLKEEIEEKNTTHSLEMKKMVRELKRSNESEKFSLDLIKDIESSNGVLEQKMSMIQKEYERRLKEEVNKQRELQLSLDEMKLTAAETIEKLKSENSKLENDLSHLRKALESASQSSQEIARLNCENDRLSKLAEEKEMELSKLKSLQEKKKMLFKRARESKSIPITQPTKNEEKWSAILNTCKSLSEGISACQHVIQNVSTSLEISSSIVE